MYYLRVNKSYLTTQVEPDIKQMLGYTKNYTYEQLLLSFEYEGEELDYIDLGSEIIVRLRLPGANLDANGNDRALNKCIKGDLQPQYLYYAYGKFGINNISTNIDNLK